MGIFLGFQGVEWGSDHFAITKNMASDGTLLGIQGDVLEAKMGIYMDVGQNGRPRGPQMLV